jgi:hypothetical protein
MSNGYFEISFDRVTYRNGQRLTARDLGDDMRRDAHLRWLHVRYLHDTWGITLGLKVQKSTNDEHAVVVGPGCAVDDRGRDILLAAGISVPLPDVSGPEPFVLVLTYLEDSAFRGRSNLAMLCFGQGIDLRHERPNVTWVRPDDVQFGWQIPLVKVVVANGAIQGSLDLRVRRNTRRLVRPHMGMGATEPGRSGWRPWQPTVLTNSGIEVVVDTSEAGFLETPYYFALLTGKGAVESLGFVTQATPSSFTYGYVIGATGIDAGVSDAGAAETNEWTVSWLGLEGAGGCEPILDLAKILPWLLKILGFVSAGG